MLSPSTTRSIWLAGAGALGGWLAEMIHRRAGVWVLPGDGPMPAWVALAYFAGLFVAIEGLRRLPVAVTRRAAAVESAILVVLFLAPPLLHPRELVLCGLTVAFAAARLLFFRARGDVTIALAVAAADALLEGALVGAGLFRYTNAAFLPLPLWLAPLWASMGLSLRRLVSFARK